MIPGERVAIQCFETVGLYEDIVGEDGALVGDNSGMYLLRKLLERYPGAALIGPEERECDGFDVREVRRLDPAQTLVISMDLLASSRVYRQMRWSPRIVPHVVNFFWGNVSDADYAAGLLRSELAVSACHFPTFTNSLKTERDLRLVIEKSMSVTAVRRSQLGSAMLGIDLPRVPVGAQDGNERPVVLFCGIYLYGRKDPLRWMRILDSVARTHEFVGRVRVTPRHWESREERVLMQRRDWADVQLQDRQAVYYGSLASVDVALACSTDESYGLAYVEAMYAGAIGVFPDKPWVWTLVPPDYPFVYREDHEAVGMMRWILDDLPRARQTVAGHGLTREHFEEHHDARKFFDAMEAFAAVHHPEVFA